MTNAIRHGEGPVDVVLRAERQHAVIQVHNAGTPIPSEAIPTLFEPFRRGDSGSTGLGLGLYIVAQVARAHGGAVTVDSSSSNGTTFELRWPRWLRGEQAEQAEASPAS